MRTVGFLGGIAVVAGLVFGGTALAQVKGAGKLSISIIATPGADPAPATPGAKPAGSVAAKASATVAGKPPTGGATTTLKLAKDLGLPLKPGFGPGTYLLEIESGATSEADSATSTGSTVFAQVVIDSAGKCTIKPHANVDGDGIGDLCGGAMQPLCAPPATGKCSITAYQLAGAVNYLLGPGTGQPVAGRFRLRKGINVADCNTGDILVGGVPLFGGTTCHDPANEVVGVMGVANGQIN
jgi:hypothetical protein